MPPKNNSTSLADLMRCDSHTGCVIEGVNATFTNLSTEQQVLDTKGQNLTISNSWLYMDQTKPAQLLINITYNSTAAEEAKQS